jgi:hypothetical protein
MPRVTDHLKLPHVHEITVMPLAVKQVDLLAAASGVEHAILSEVVSRSVPVKGVAGLLIVVLLLLTLFLAGDEQDDFVVVARCHHSRGQRLKPSVAPELGEVVARVRGADLNLGERYRPTRRSSPLVGRVAAGPSRDTLEVIV